VTEEHFPQVPNVPYRGENELEIKAHLAFEAQLRHTEKLIHSALNDHAHFTDDCGEYLSAALDLSSQLSSARENGTKELLDQFELFAGPDPEDPDADYSKMETLFATDGVADEVNNFISALGKAE
jgi:hypothetical protein